MQEVWRGVAQLGLRRYLGVVEIGGSNPLTPIKLMGRALRRGSSATKTSADARWCSNGGWFPATTAPAGQSQRSAQCGRVRRSLVAENPLAPIFHSVGRFVK